jgi:membrane-associated phospholipid phosphatase
LRAQQQNAAPVGNRWRWVAVTSLPPASYALLLLAVYLRYGVVFQFTLGLVALPVLPVVAYFSRSKEFLRSAVFLVTVLLIYEALQGITGALVGTGSVISLGFLDVDLLGVNLSQVVQNAFDSGAVTMVSLFFYGLHVFLVVGAAVLFWFANRMVFKGFAYSIVVTSYVALFTFVLLPTAPPWISGGVLDLLREGYAALPAPLQSLQSALLSIESDPFAAFPSLHAAYATLFSAYMFRLKRLYGLLSLPILFGVFFATLYLGQHYLVDLLGGVAYALASVVLVDKLTREEGGVMAAVKRLSGRLPAL